MSDAIRLIASLAGVFSRNDMSARGVEKPSHSAAAREALMPCTVASRCQSSYSPGLWQGVLGGGVDVAA